jgi:hypothetical protein
MKSIFSAAALGRVRFGKSIDAQSMLIFVVIDLPGRRRPIVFCS